MKRIIPASLIAALLALAGCQQAAAPFGLMTTAQYRANLAVIDDAAGTINDEDLSWAGAIAQQPGAKPLPDLSNATPEQRAAWYRAHQERHDKLRDVLANPTTQPTP